MQQLVENDSLTYMKFVGLGSRIFFDDYPTISLISSLPTYDIYKKNLGELIKGHM